MATIYEVVEGYFKDPFKDRHSSSKNVFCEDGILYSYGYHFPLAVGLSMRPGFFLLNGDRYSRTTDKHQSYVRRCIKESNRAIIPFTAMAEAFNDMMFSGYYRLMKFADYVRQYLEVIDHSEDQWRMVNIKDPKTGEIKQRSIHILGGSVFKVGTEYYLSSMDDSAKSQSGMYFLTRLPEPAENMSDAYEVLKPEDILGLAENEYIRQGEWFFVPAPDMKIPEEHVVKGYALRNRGRSPRDWNHIATYGAEMSYGCEFVRGTVRHPEHKMVSFPDKKMWYQAYEAPGAGPNGEVLSWSAGGNVD